MAIAWSYHYVYKRRKIIYVRREDLGRARSNGSVLTVLGDFLRILSEIEALYLLCDEQKGQLIR